MNCLICPPQERYHLLHDPYICRVVPAMLKWFAARKRQQPGFKTPPGIVHAVLTQTLHDSVQFDRAGYMEEFCEYVATNADEYFDCIYRDEPYNFQALREHVLSKSIQVWHSAFFVRK